MKTWTETGRNLLSPHMSGSDISKIIRATSAAERLTALQEAVTAFGRHRSGWARWVEREQRTQGVTFTANVSPVNVGHLLRANLWEFQDEEFPVSVTAISATLPGNYPFQAGLDGQVQRYPSPFDEAYARSALFVPQLTGEDEIARVTQVGSGNRLKFNVSKHPAWAAEHIARLVEANGGSALVLAAKADDGRLYADVLRRRLPGIAVHSQWDGGSTQRVVAAWRDDIGSVLVGTKSLMTGVDAPGETCTLVIVDRVPRSPSNPVDDARVDEITERSGDKWAADRAVYVTDAALLLSQAAGRLVRATSDTGMVACLDPRLLKASGGRPGSLTYNEQTRQVYMGPLREFGVKIADPHAALRWLRDRAATARR